MRTRASAVARWLLDMVCIMSHRVRWVGCPIAWMTDRSKRFERWYWDIRT